MARGRMISKAISLDEKVNALPDDTARLLFTWIIPHLDCEGRLHGDATTIKSIVFPRRNVSIKKIEKYLKKMEDLKLILRFSVNGNQYLCAPHFEKHQTGLQKSRESQSQIPPPPLDLLQIYSRPRLDKVIPKLKIKSKLKYKIKNKSIDTTNNKLAVTPDEIAEIATLYGEEIGQITSMVGQALNDAVQQYPVDQIKDAIKEAALRNKRSWKYIEAILENWKAKGRGVKDDKYAKQKYGNMVRR